MATTNIQDIYQLSPLQQGMLFYSLKYPQAGLYIVQLACTLEGSLHIDIFSQTWQKLIDRHTIFRTAFYWKEADKPLQVVNKEAAPTLEQLDWRNLSATEQSTNLETFFEEDRQRGFDFSRPPLMRLTLIQLADTVYQFVWSYHHLLLDGWSLSQVLHELFAIYETTLSNEHYPLPVSNPYKNYIAWLQQQDQNKAEAFWREQLQGITASTPLVMENIRPQLSDSMQMRGDEAQIHLSTETTAALQQLIQKQQLTMNTLVQGAWALLLNRYTGEKDVIHGTVVSGRPASLDGVEKMVGPFINTLPLRVQIEPFEPTLLWLKNLNQQQMKLREFEYSALVDVQSWSNIPRGQPLFETSVVFENYPLEASLQDERLSLRISNLRDIERTNFALGLLALPGPQLLLKIVYDANRFTHDSIERILNHLEVLLQGIAADCQQPVGKLPLLTAFEQQQLTKTWNETDAPYPADKSIIHLFETQVARVPDAIAVTFGEQQLTYAQLNRQANRLAHYLRSIGVGPEVIVGVSIDRSLDMIVALLAILKAGGAYLPLDPTYPASRLDFILQDTQVPVVLTTKQFAPQLTPYQTKVFCVDEEKLALAEFSAENPTSSTMATNLAYIIYTSGSTGKPKGTLVNHTGVTNLATFNKEHLGIDENSHVLQFASLNFDGAVWEIFAPLCNGGTLHLTTLEIILAAPALVAFMKEHHITMATLPPSVLSLMPATELPDLKILFSAGEACTTSVVERWAKNCKFYNGYGPTETTVGLTYHQVTATDSAPPIGRPFPNKQIYVLDDQLRPLPIGVPGELYAGGNGLARGYLNRPQLTAERFVPNPFSNKPGDRLYRTGDLVRYKADGNLEYLGRVDNQVKIRGFRIELGEIEALLLQQPQIEEAVVIVREDDPANKRLVAYYRTQNGISLDPQHLKTNLKEQLPAYMIPTTLMQLEKFPLTANGKIDRTTLPEPEALQTVRTGLVAPQTDTERTIMAIWQDVLQMQQISTADNFFDLGGHSLLMMQVNAKLQKTLKRDVAMIDLFQYATIQALAHHLDGGKTKVTAEQIHDRVKKQKAALKRRKKKVYRQN